MQEGKTYHFKASMTYFPVWSSLKAMLLGDPSPTVTEIRRFSLSDDMTYYSLHNTLTWVFELLPSAKLQLSWKDLDGDLIDISSTMELTEAIKYMEKMGRGDFHIYVKKQWCS